VALTQTGSLTGSTVTLSTVGSGGMTLGGSIAATTSLSLNTTAGGVQEATGTIVTPTLLTTTGLTGDVILTGTANLIGNLGTFGSGIGLLKIVDGQSLVLNGPVTTSNGATISVTGALTLAGSLTASGTQTVSLTATGALNQTGGVLTAGTLSASAASINLGQGNTIGVFGTIASQGNLSLTNSAPLTIAGAVSGSNVTLSTTGSTSDVTLTGSLIGTSGLTLNGAGGIFISGTISTPGSLNITTQNGNLTQTGGLISVGTLLSAGGIAGNASLAGGTNRIATLGSFAATGSLTLVDTGTLTVAGPVTAGASSSLSATAGITLAGNVTAPGLELAAASGGVSQTGGILTLGSLTAAGGIVGGASLTSSSNQIATLGSISITGGDLVLADASNVSLAGAITTPNASITTPGSITIPGTVTTGTLALNAGGTIVRPANAGAFTVGKLTGSAVTIANFGTASNVTVLGQFVVTGSTLTLSNAQPLTVTGPVSAEFMRITATDTLTLSGTIITTGISLANLTGNASTVGGSGSYFAVVSSGNGTATIRELGTLVVLPAANSQTATLNFNLPTNGGTIVLDNLVARTTNIVLNTNNGGVVSGQIDIGSLTLIGTNGSSLLNGLIANTTGPEAAHLAAITPDPSATYRLNSCPIGSVNCVLIPVAGLPPANPLRDYVLDAGRNQSADDDISLPDVSSRDY
jgi:hypothetical protein